VAARRRPVHGAAGLFSYGPGDDRATGYLYAEGEQPWPESLARRTGPALCAALGQRFGERFTVVAFQAYRDGSGCDWHADTPFGAQAVLSLGVTRTFGVRWVGGEPTWIKVGHGDLVYMPPGFQDDRQHSVPTEDVTGERVLAGLPHRGEELNARGRQGEGGRRVGAGRHRGRQGRRPHRPGRRRWRNPDVTVDGVPEERVHPTTVVHHVRLLSPDRMVPDELREVGTYEEACELAVRYAWKLNENAGRLAELAADLKKV
jgi:hypothetical protein